MNDEVVAVTEALARPFDPAELKWRAGAKGANGSAMALVYIDARLVQDRLDEVLGISGWADDYTLLPDGQVVCKLQLKLGGEWVTKVDVGGQSEQPDDGDKMKAAFSDALKRTAVKFGIGRDLYRFGPQWVAHDGKRFASKPQVPDWYLAKWREHSGRKPTRQEAEKQMEAADRLISQEEGRELQAAIKVHGASWKQIAEFYHITRLGELPWCHFSDCLRRVKSKHASVMPAATTNGAPA